MTISSINHLGTGSNSVSSSTFSGAFSAPWDDDSTALVAVVSENIATTSGETNTHTSFVGASLEFIKVGERTVTHGAAADGVTISLWRRSVSTGVGTLNFTATFTAAVTRKCAVARKVISDLDLMVDFVDGRTNLASSQFGTLAASGLPNRQRVWFRASAMAYYASTNATPTSGWSIGNTVGTGSGASGIMGRNEYKIATSTGETSSMTQNIADDSASIMVALSEDTGAATITLTPDPASVNVGATRQITISRSEVAPAGAGVTYNLTSSAPAVATVPATVNIAEGESDATFNVTGVSLGGSVTITATNTADSGETDTSTVNVVAQTKLKLLAHIDALGATAVKGAVFEAPAGGAMVGALIGEFTGAAFKSVSESGQAPLEIDVDDFGGTTLTTADTPVVVWEGTSSATSALGNAVPIGSVGPHECVVVEV